MNNVKKILMVNLPFSGHTNPTLGLAKVLVSLGHVVSYVQSPDWEEKIKNTGAEFIPYDNYPQTLSPSKKEMRSWGAAYNTVKRIGKEYDCLIYEMLFLPGKALADELGIPAFRLFSTFTLNEKILTYFGRTGGWYMTRLFYYKFLYKKVSKIIQKKFNLRYDTIGKEMVYNAPYYNFTYTIKEFQIFVDEFDPEHYKYVGPSLDIRKIDTAFDLSFVDSPLIYISLGTLLNTSVSFFKKCIAAFKNKPVTVIMSIGTIVKAEKLGEIPKNIHVFPFVPQLKILQNAQLFITHGGMNSVNESIYYGVPMLAIPVGNDQPAVARRIEELHLGKYLSRKGLTSKIILEASIDIINNPIYKEKMHIYQLKMQQAGGNRQIANDIINYLK